MMTKQLLVKQKTKCLRCNEPAIIVAVERLPNRGIAYKAIHDDATASKDHEWAEYKTAEDSGRQDYVKNPKIINCPRCHKRGRIGYGARTRQPYRVYYHVVHEQIKGRWGKEKQMAKRRRCYIFDPKQRIIILKRLGRYIAPAAAAVTVTDGKEVGV
jgi:hypothetical protein